MLGHGSVSETPLAATPAAGGAQSLTLVADPGAYTLTGSDATLQRASQMVADAGSMTLAGSAATMPLSVLFTSDTGSLSIAGASAELQRALTLAADAGSLTLTGSDATLTLQRLMVLAPGAYSLTGYEAELTSTATPTSSGQKSGGPPVGLPFYDQPNVQPTRDRRWVAAITATVFPF